MAEKSAGEVLRAARKLGPGWNLNGLRFEQNGSTETFHVDDFPIYAAAPAMLDALKLLQGFDFRLDDSAHGKEIRQRARKAIALAETGEGDQ